MFWDVIFLLTAGDLSCGTHFRLYKPDDIITVNKGFRSNAGTSFSIWFFVSAFLFLFFSFLFFSFHSPDPFFVLYLCFLLLKGMCIDFIESTAVKILRVWGYSPLSRENN